MKKIILATLISGAMSASALAEDPVDPVPNMGSGTVTFTGSIIDAPCSIAPNDDNDNQDVYLGQVSNITLENGGASSPKPFSIRLEGCNLKNKNQVMVTFNGTESPYGGASNGYLAISDGKASGAAVKIMDELGNQIKVNSPDAYDQSYIEGNNTLKFQAALQGFNGVETEPGNFSATTTFTLNYN
ncbi:fimbrial protein [Providencia manganoxydans]|uniref:fimbrial protein n=1 Tax=Providencia manganoxydans TaxID=2923283 RepID=UPI0034E3770C